MPGLASRQTHRPARWLSARELPMVGIGARVRTAFALGPADVIRVLAYRLGLKLGVHPVLRIAGERPSGPFFAAPAVLDSTLPSVLTQKTSLFSFGWHENHLGEAPPDWHSDPITGRRLPNPDRPWWKIPDFDPSIGDIKTIWEASRFGWVVALAQRAKRGDDSALEQLEAWVENWLDQNPPYCGPNWKCGQETSLRLLHLAAGALVLDQLEETRPGLLDLVSLSLARIAPTRAYAMAQRNNHATSEAAGLFVGGSWLLSNGRREGTKWTRQGRQLLEDSINRLVMEDGSFSQYSVVYHRLMLDTLSFAEIVRRRLGQPAFSARFYERAAAATEWLGVMTVAASGDAPNLGANDGAQILDFSQSGFRDFRPSVVLASALFCDRRAYDDEGRWNSPLRWLGLDVPTQVAHPQTSKTFDVGGFAVLRHGEAHVVVRYPRYRFRPAQADALHLDLTVGGINHLRDAGTYSYNTSFEWLDYFGGTKGHNTVMFDDRDQMPRLGRFLFGDWLKSDAVDPVSERGGVTQFSAAYRDSWNAKHQRAVELMRNRLAVTDEVSGFLKSAVLRWRLSPGEWSLQGNTLTGESGVLTVVANVPLVRLNLVAGWESRFYLSKSPVPVLEAEIAEPGRFSTEYVWGR